MKKLLCMLLIVLSPVSYSGIPTFDITAFTQMIQDATIKAQQFQQTMNEARNRLEMMKEQQNHYKSMVEGHFNFEDILNDLNANEFLALDDWKDIYDDVAELNQLREQFNLFSDDPIVQQQYDNQLKQFNLQNKMYDSAVERNDRMKSLLNEFSTATTPAAKDDIANSLRLEQLQMQNDAQMMQTMNALMSKERVMKADQSARESSRRLLNEGIPRS
ncbi:type IV secretion system protein [Vibrio sp. SS-MA-C1-2]|uniref:type IV secretion system protein n=1 Tax=Vibrio sp. SS-MA-C1-2 TaxID=2908646 RepID=UPI001F3EFBE0|nr:type IV secretion system protein [Vibrio sp. SS-MA-C1-2]UJF17255.1 type IV secretion system protein [Vibrio sp. SS-MA-C1-2]